MNADHHPTKASGPTGLDTGGRTHRVAAGLAGRGVRSVRRGADEAQTLTTGALVDQARDASAAAVEPAVAAVGPRFGRTLEDLRADLPLAILAAVVAAVAAVLLGADPALAQGTGGTGSEINNAITQLSTWLATLVVSLGGVALLIAVIVWLFSGSDQKRREGAVRWIGSIMVAIFVGLSVPAIIALIQSFAGGGGG